MTAADSGTKGTGAVGPVAAFGLDELAQGAQRGHRTDAQQARAVTRVRG